MVVYSVDLDGKDSGISKEVLARDESPLDHEIEDREVAYLMVERHLLKELKLIVKKIREVRRLKNDNY